MDEEGKVYTTGRMVSVEGSDMSFLHEERWKSVVGFLMLL